MTLDHLAFMPSGSGRSSLIGVAISLIGNILISLALNCQKLAHVRLEREGNNDGGEQQALGQENGSSENQALLHPSTSSQNSPNYGTSQGGPDHGKKTNGASQTHNEEGQGPQNESMSTTFLKSKLWWVGISLMTLGEFGNFLSYGFAPASLVAPLGAVALLSNVIISPIMLKERFFPSDIGGILLAIIGAVTVVFSSKQSDATLNPDELMEAISQKGFIAYVIVAFILAATLAWASTTVLGQRYILLDVGVCAVLGGFTVLSTKGLSSLLSQGKPLELLRYPITYGLVIVLAGTALAQITYLNRALQRFDSREVIPTQFVMFTISAIVGSAILYRDFADMDAHQLINFFFGCMTTFAGVFFLTRQKDDQQKSEEHNQSQSDIEIGVEAQDSEERTSVQSDQERTLIPVAAPKTARPISMGLARNPRAITTGSVPTLANVQNQGNQTLLTLTPASSSVNSTSGSVPKFIVTRRSIFNPAFPVAFIESSPKRQRLPE